MRVRQLPSKVVAEIFQQFERHSAQPTTELCYQTPFELLVAVVLSAQATDVAVNKATRQLFQVANTPKEIVQLGEAKLISYVRTIGLYRAKARHIIATANLLLERHAGDVPCSRDALEALPGVGRKTANVLLNTLFGQPVIAVDTHVFRVANRTGIALGKTVLAVEQKLEKRIPRQYRQHAHHWLILHGRYTCAARKPHCYRCCIVNLCLYQDKRCEPQRTTSTP